MKLIYRDKTWELRGGMTVRDAILKVGLHPDAVLALRDGVLINEETILADDDVIRLVAVVSGG
ncbi:MAG: MoaD/ThiS family protein [Anaerolineae bacterium]